MSELKRCPQCQAEIPVGTPEGLCPSCLLKEGLAQNSAEAEQRTTPYSPGASPFVPPTPAELQPAFPQLEILELLGKGGMGAVYKARQPKLDRLVAVKILPPEVSRDPAFAERFNREARALAKLNHPNIVGVHDFGQEAGYCYFVMEFVDGVNLHQAMRAGNLKAAEALKIVPQICDALQFAHDEGVVHRDIKPENILLDRKGRVKIADFGLAKLLGKSIHDVSLTGTQQVMGTLHYMAPEQLEGSRDVDHRADIYSLGVTFYEMLTGELPIGRFAPPSKKVQVDVRLDEVVLRSLEKEPELRYQHASEIKSEMESISRGPATITAVAPLAAGPWQMITRIFGGVSLLAAAPLLLLGFVQLDLIEREGLWNDPDAKWWYLISGLLILAGVFMFAGGIGLLMLKRWGHRIVVGASSIALVVLAAETAVVLAKLITPFHSAVIFDFVWPAIIDWLFLLAQTIVLLQGNVLYVFSRADQRGVDNPVLSQVHVRPAIVRIFGFLNLLAAVPVLILAMFEVQGVIPGSEALELNRNINQAADRLSATSVQTRDDAKKVLAAIRAEMKTWKISDRRSTRDYYQAFENYINSWEEAGNQQFMNRVLASFPVLQKTFTEFNSDHITQMLFESPASYLSAALNFLAGFALIIGGIGLLLCDRWGQRCIVVVAVIQVVHLLIPFLILLASPKALKDLWHATDTHGWALFFVIVSAVTIVVWFFLLAQIIVLTRARFTGFFAMDRAPEESRLPGYVRAVVIPVVALAGLLSVLYVSCVALVPEKDPVILSTLFSGNVETRTPERYFVVQGGAVLIGLVFLLLNLVWAYRQRFGESQVTPRVPMSRKWRVVLVAGICVWTGLCLTLFLRVGMPAPTVLNPIDDFLLDVSFMPYQGTSQSNVSLEPTHALCPRVLIREEAAAAHRGVSKGPILLPASRFGLKMVKLTYTVAVETKQRERLVVDGLNGMSWRIEASGGTDESGAVLDAGVVSRWLDLATMGPDVEKEWEQEWKKQDPDGKFRGWRAFRQAELQKQARAIVDILRGAAHDDVSDALLYGDRPAGFQRLRMKRKLVSRLDIAVANQMGGIDQGQPRPFRDDWSAAATVQWDPVVPILYVSVPLMLTVWIGGMWLMVRVVRGAQ